MLRILILLVFASTAALAALDVDLSSPSNYLPWISMQISFIAVDKPPTEQS